jgi:hypothetical protein
MSDETQPLPTPGEGDIMLALERRVRQRREKGIAMYGRSLQAFNGRRALVDALEEAVDLAAYLEQELHERAKLEARVAGAAQSHATHVASGNLEAGCGECFHFLQAQLGGQYAQLAGAFQKLWEAKPAEPVKCECGHPFAWHDTAGCSVALCKCQTTRKPQPEAAPVASVTVYEPEQLKLEGEVANLKAQLAAARGETLGGQTLTRINRTLREQLQAANARADDNAVRMRGANERAEKAEALQAFYREASDHVLKNERATLAERDAALKAKEAAEAERLRVAFELMTLYPADTNGDCGVVEGIRTALQAERKRADEWQRKWEDLEVKRASCCDQMEQERDEAQAQAAALEKTALDNVQHLRGHPGAPHGAPAPARAGGGVVARD